MGNKISSTLHKFKLNFSKPRFMQSKTSFRSHNGNSKEEVIEAKNEDCPICLCEVDDEKPLYCGHKVHTYCLEQQIDHGSKRMGTEHISFNFICCPLCRLQLSSPSINQKLDPYVKLKEQVDKLALKSIVKLAEDVLKDVEDPKKHVKNLKKQEKIELGYRKLLFYLCEDCNQPFCGGAYSCLEAAIEANAQNNSVEGHNEIEEVEVKNENEVNQIVLNEEDVSMELIHVNQLIENKSEENVQILSNGVDVSLDFKRKDDVQILTCDDDEDTSYDVTYFDDLNDEDDNAGDDFGVDEKKDTTKDLVMENDIKLLVSIPIPPVRPLAKQEISPPIINEEIKEENKEEKKAENVNAVNADNAVNNEVNAEEKQESKLLCTDCLRRKSLTGNCKHGFDELQYKCIKCCSPATYYCLGTEFYCDRCHGDLSTLYPCPGPKSCPLGCPHPPNQLGTHGGGGRVIPFAISCSICGPIARSFDNSILSNFSVRYG